MQKKHQIKFNALKHTKTLLQSHSHQDSIVLAQRQKQINGTEQKAQRKIHEPMDTLSSTKEARIYNGQKTNSLTSGAGKTGQPLVRE